MIDIPAKERPILFSAPMVRAILDGRKTQTRRLVKLKNGWARNGADIDVLVDQPSVAADACPYGRVGDRLWVREAFGIVDSIPQYRAGGDGHPVITPLRWTPSIHMPRWASRIDLVITSVHVERLQSISEEDCLNEGIEHTVTGDHMEGDLMVMCKNYMACGRVVYTAAENDCLDEDLLDYDLAVDPKESFKSLWQSINGADSWDSNPWVWVVEFDHLKKKGY